VNQEDPRLGDLFKTFSSDLTKGSWVLAGYPDDEGVHISRGRPGAAEAPEAIRRQLYSMTPALNAENLSALKLLEYGDLDFKNVPLAERHELGRKAAQQVLKNGGRWLAFGGGHDFGYADGAAFLDVFTREKPLVINFDAHLDVRPTTNGLSSGTPFRRLLDQHAPFDFLEIGIQNQCNSRSHLKWLQDKGGQILPLDKIRASIQAPQVAIQDFLAPWLRPGRPVYLSIDLDAFASCFAPGCSQSWPTGLAPDEVLGSIDFIASRAEVMVAGLYEVAPVLDLDHRTAKLAALCAHRIIFASMRSPA
jgi:formiminoglutamase